MGACVTFLIHIFAVEMYLADLMSMEAGKIRIIRMIQKGKREESQSRRKYLLYVCLTKDFYWEQRILTAQ